VDADEPALPALRRSTSRPRRHLQAHADHPGDEDVDAWADLVEVPYRSLAGAVELALLTTGSGDEDLRLGEPGLYRLRVAHRPLPLTIGAAADEDDEDEDRKPTDLWQLDFWPVTGTVEPTRWVRRMRPAVRPANPGWTSLLGFQAIEIANVVRWTRPGDGMTVPGVAGCAIGESTHRTHCHRDRPSPPS
jgi:hypothetical protein